MGDSSWCGLGVVENKKWSSFLQKKCLNLLNKWLQCLGFLNQWQMTTKKEDRDKMEEFLLKIKDGLSR